MEKEEFDFFPDFRRENNEFENMTRDELEEKILKMDKALNFYKPMYLRYAKMNEQSEEM